MLHLLAHGEVGASRRHCTRPSYFHDAGSSSTRGERARVLRSCGLRESVKDGPKLPAPLIIPDDVVPIPEHEVVGRPPVALYLWLQWRWAARGDLQLCNSLHDCADLVPSPNTTLLVLASSWMSRRRVVSRRARPWFKTAVISLRSCFMIHPGRHAGPV